MLRLHVSQVKQRYDITPDFEKGANNETENHTHIEFILIILSTINSLTHKSLRANVVLNGHARRCRFYSNTAECLVKIRGVFSQVRGAQASELDQIVVQ